MVDFHHYALEVKNIEHSKDFYINMLNFEEEASHFLLEEKLTFLKLGVIRLELTENKQLIQHQHQVHVCFRVKSLTEIIQTFGEAGLAHTEGPYHLDNGWKVVFYHGPDGEMLEFLEE